MADEIGPHAEPSFPALARRGPNERTPDHCPIKRITDRSVLFLHDLSRNRSPLPEPRTSFRAGLVLILSLSKDDTAFRASLPSLVSIAAGSRNASSRRRGYVEPADAGHPSPASCPSCFPSGAERSQAGLAACDVDAAFGSLATEPRDSFGSGRGASNPL